MFCCTLDPQLGRWWQLDPEVEQFYAWTPYNSNLGNPIRYEDKDGDFPGGGNDPENDVLFKNNAPEVGGGRGGGGTPSMTTAQIRAEAQRVLAEYKQKYPDQSNATNSTTKASQATTTSDPKGGVYVLKDPNTGKVERSGRTKDLDRRKGEHRKNAETGGLKFDVKYKTDDYKEQRGLEQKVHDEHKPPLNKIEPISDKNPRKPEYIKAADSYLQRHTVPANERPQ